MRGLLSLTAAVALATSALPGGAPATATALARPALPAYDPEFLVQTDACEPILDRSGELTLDGFAVSATDAGGGQSDVEVDATIHNGDVGSFDRAAAIPDFTGAPGLSVATIPPVESMDFDDIAPHGAAASLDSMRLRLPTAQVPALQAALADGSVSFTVHARERLVLRPNTYLVRWSSVEDFYAANPTHFPVWTSEADPPFGIGEVPDGNRVFVIKDDYTPVNIPSTSWYVEYEDGVWDDQEHIWKTQFGAFDWEHEDIDEVIVSGTFCAESATHDPDEGRPVRFNDVQLGAVSVSGQVAGQLLKVDTDLSVRDGQGRWDFSIGMDATLALELTAQATAHVDATAHLIDVCFPILSIPVGITTIQGAINLEHEVTASGDAVAGAVVGFEKRFDGGYRMGFDTRLPVGQRFFSESFWTPSPTEFTPPRLTDDSGLTLRAAAGLELGLAFGYPCPVDLISAGAHARADIFGELTVEPDHDPWWTLSHGASLSAGLDFSVLGYDLVGLEAPTVELLGSETREGHGALPAAGAPTLAAPTTATSGEDVRWALSLEDLVSPSGYADTSVVELEDGSIVLSGNQLIAAFTPDGQLEWSRRLKAGTNFQAESLYQVDADTVGIGLSELNNFATLGTIAASDGHALGATKYAVTWSLGGPNQQCALEDAITFEDAGQRGFLFVGRILGDNASSYDICAVRLDAAGGVVWAKVYADDGVQYAHAVARTPDGGFAVVGSTVWGPDQYHTGNLLALKLAGDGTLAWARSLVTTVYRTESLTDVVIAPDGTWYVAGQGSGTVLDDGALLVGSIAADGSSIDTHVYDQDVAWETGDGAAFDPYHDTQGGSTPYDAGFGVALAPGGFVVAGRTSVTSGITDPSALWMLKLGEDLRVEWFRTWDGGGDDQFNEVVRSADGFIASGSSRSVAPLGTGGSPTLVLAKTAFEGGVDLLPGTELTDRYIEPRPGGLESVYSVPEYSGEAYADPGMTTYTATVVTSAVTGLTQATAPSVCVQLLTEPGNPSLTDGCTTDDDGDAVATPGDDCPTAYDPDQVDTDDDGLGDACDDDDDADGVLDAADGCPLVAEDLDGYRDGDGCPEPGSYTTPCLAIPTIMGSGVGETIEGTPGSDVIFGYGGNDVINGNGGNDLVCAGGGNDTVTTLAGRDGISGGNGNDTIDSGAGPDRVHGDAGNDTVRGGLGADTIWGDDDIDMLHGNGDADVIRGGRQNDHIWGDAGGDRLYGEGGGDTIRGGPGTDTCDGGPGSNTLLTCP